MFGDYSDQAIEDAKTSDSRGERNSAPYLAELATPAQRKRAISEAWTLGNLMGGNFSGNVYNAVRSLKDLIAAGREDSELYGERVAREFREAEADRKAAQLAAFGATARAARGA